MAVKKTKKTKKTAKKIKPIKQETIVEAPVIAVETSESVGNPMSQEGTETPSIYDPTVLEGHPTSGLETPISETTISDFQQPEQIVVNDATAKPLNQAWLTLQTGSQYFKDSICLADIFNNGQLAPSRAAQGQALWAVLAKHKFFLHPRIEDSYRKQQTCLFCGGQVVIRSTDIGTDAYCNDCKYLYSEES